MQRVKIMLRFFMVMWRNRRKHSFSTISSKHCMKSGPFVWLVNVETRYGYFVPVSWSHGISSSAVPIDAESSGSSSHTKDDRSRTEASSIDLEWEHEVGKFALEVVSIRSGTNHRFHSISEFSHNFNTCTRSYCLESSLVLSVHICFSLLFIFFPAHPTPSIFYPY